MRILKEGKSVLPRKFYGKCHLCGCEFECSESDADYQHGMVRKVAYWHTRCPNTKCLRIDNQVTLKEING